MAQILVVDDQEDIVQLVVKALELQNHKDGAYKCFRLR